MSDPGRTFVKICGITRFEDADAAARAGADAVGFVFAPSPRQISPDAADAITARLHPSIRRIGVFVDPSIALLQQTVEAAGLDGVQVHGALTADLVAQFRGAYPSATIFRVIRSAGAEQAAEAAALGVDGIFVDPKDPDEPMKAMAQIPVPALAALKLTNLIVAGGLNPSNVGALVAELAPWGVDVSGGVESAPGIKDAALMRSFVRAVRTADAGRSPHR